jgi:hypothetical protein
MVPSRWGIAIGTESRASEFELVEALRRGDVRAFAELVDRNGAAILRVARAYERDRAVSEESCRTPG